MVFREPWASAPLLTAVPPSPSDTPARAKPPGGTAKLSIQNSGHKKPSTCCAHLPALFDRGKAGWLTLKAFVESEKKWNKSLVLDWRRGFRANLEKRSQKYFMISIGYFCRVEKNSTAATGYFNWYTCHQGQAERSRA